MSTTRPDFGSLLMVYNAGDGFFNALNDWAHKIFSPSTYDCTLCFYTYGLTGMLRPWKAFIEKQPMHTRFLHRTEFKKRYPQFQSTPLPLILREKKGQIEILMTADEIKATGGVAALMDILQPRLEGLGSNDDGGVAGALSPTAVTGYE